MTDLEFIEVLKDLLANWREDYYTLEARLKEVAAERDALKNELRILHSQQPVTRYLNPLDQQHYPYTTKS